MTQASPGFWDQLVAAFEEAERGRQEAGIAYDRLPLPANEVEGKCPEELAWDEAYAQERIAEDRLFRVVAPHPAGAALQLRIFASRHHSADFSKPADGPEESEVAMLRCIYDGLCQLS